MSRLSAILLLLSITGSVYGQTSVVLDSLNWQRYYPLEVGNVWVYGGLDPQTRVIIGDTLTNNHRYFIRRDSIPASGTLGPFIHTYYLRYDTSGVVLTLPSIDADTLEAPFDAYIDHEGFRPFFDLQAAFGDTLVAAMSMDTLYYVSGRYNETIEIGNRFETVDGYKCFQEHAVAFGACYATDIGLTSSGNLFGPVLRYANIGGNVFGSTSITKENEAAPLPQAGILSIYPNPFPVSATLTYRLPAGVTAQLDVFDVLGRRVWHEELSTQAAGASQYHLLRKDWPAGTYFVRLTGPTGASSVMPFVIID